MISKNVVISRRRDAHRCHHAAAKCILVLKNATPPMQNLEAFREIAELTLRISPSGRRGIPKDGAVAIERRCGGSSFWGSYQGGLIEALPPI